MNKGLKLCWKLIRILKLSRSCLVVKLNNNRKIIMKMIIMNFRRISRKKC